MHQLYLEGIPVNHQGQGPFWKGIAVKHFPSVIGRQSECDHCLKFAFISRRHCAFFVHDDRIWVQDLGSQNGTLLNGERLVDARPIRDGDRLDLAYLSFHVRLGATAPREDSITTIQAAGSPVS